jgi:hypothetical protein
MKTIITVLLLASCIAASARLGESNVEVAARYGAVQKRVNQGTNTWLGYYVFKEYNVLVSFRDNKSEVETIRPITARKFSDDERDALIKNIGGDGDWVEDNSHFEFMAKTWVNTKTKALAYVKDDILEPSTLFIMTRDYVSRENAKEQENDKAKADGF